MARPTPVAKAKGYLGTGIHVYALFQPALKAYRSDIYYIKSVLYSAYYEENWYAMDTCIE